MAESSDRYGRYELRGELGRGGFATVYRAWDPELHREVALKALLQHLSMDEDIRQRFLAEAQSTAQLHHPNIVTVYAVNQVEDRPYFTMELINGPTLTSVIKSDGALSLARVVEILRGLGSALDYLHSRRLVHRDIKASNVMLDTWSRTVLMDFGVARTLDQTQLTRSGVSIGTPEAMAPEQVRGIAVGPPADIYALGVLAYRLLAGRPPFTGETIYVLHAHAYDPPPPLKQYRQDLPEGVSEAIEAALAKAPEDRPATAEQFVAALSAPLSEQTISIPSARFVPMPPHSGEPRTPTPPPAPVEGTPAAREKRPPESAPLADAPAARAAPSGEEPVPGRATPSEREAPPDEEASPSLTPFRLRPLPPVQPPVSAKPAGAAQTPETPRAGVPVSGPPVSPTPAEKVAPQEPDEDSAAAKTVLDLPRRAAPARPEESEARAGAGAPVEPEGTPRGDAPAHEETAMPLMPEAPRPDREREWVERKPPAILPTSAGPSGRPPAAPPATTPPGTAERGERRGPPWALIGLGVAALVIVGAIAIFAISRGGGSKQTNNTAIVAASATTSSPPASATASATENATVASTVVAPVPTTTRPPTQAPTQAATVRATQPPAPSAAPTSPPATPPPATPAPPPPPAFPVTLLAGSGTAGIQDGAADQAQFRGPKGVTSDGSGAVYVADTDNSSIRRIGSDGRVTTLAGPNSANNAPSGYADQPGAAARFNRPRGLVAAKDGTLYIADTENNRIRRVDRNGAVGTVAGSGGTTVGGGGFADGPGGQARFNLPAGIAIDDSNSLYIADSRNNRIRKIDTNGNVSTIAGAADAGSADGQGGAARFNQPSAIATDGKGNLFVADTFNGLIRKIATDGQVTTYAGGGPQSAVEGPAKSVAFNIPEGIAVDGAGNVYVADQTQRVRMITPDGNVVVVAGGQEGFADGTGAQARFNFPSGVALDDSSIFVADSSNNRIRKIALK